MEEIKSKVQKSSKVISIFFKICSILMIMLIGVGIILMAVFAFMSDGAFVQMQGEAFGVWGGAQLLVTDGASEVAVNEISKLNFMGLGVTIALNGILLLIIFSNIRITFKEISENYTPFSMKNVKRIKIVGIVTAFSSAILYCVSSVLVGQEVYSMSLSNFLIGAAIYCLAYMFEYGCMLQKQSDETL